MDALKLEIAARAAQMVADSGLDYGSAKRKAALEAWGSGSLPKESLPSNEDIDLALLEHFELFDEAHPGRVLLMRRVALELMDRLSEFQTYLTGAAWKGVCAEHAFVHLQIFHDNPKEVEYALLNFDIPYEAETTTHWRGDREIEALALLYKKDSERVPVLISLYETDELRGALKVKIHLRQSLSARGDRKALIARMQEESTVREKKSTDTPPSFNPSSTEQPRK
jgi:hypothetical protein